MKRQVRSWALCGREGANVRCPLSGINGLGPIGACLIRAGLFYFSEEIAEVLI